MRLGVPSKAENLDSVRLTAGSMIKAGITSSSKVQSTDSGATAGGLRCACPPDDAALRLSIRRCYMYSGAIRRQW